ncbi:MAG: DUF2092 domain-containing protein [Pseudolabrys sp.]
MLPTRPKLNAALKLIGALALALTTILGASLGARAQNENDAGKILKAMSDYVTSQKTVSLKFDASIEVITPELQKIQFNNSGTLLLHRPNKLRAARKGGYADVEFFFDGKTFTVFDKGHNRFAQSATASSVDQLVDKLGTEYSVQAPGADLLVSNPYKQLMAGVIDAKDIGPSVVDGVECEQLAFRNHDVDWQIWIQAGPKPIPRKYVITSKTVAGAPQYTLLVKGWNTDVAAGPDAFSFKAPADAKKVELKDLRDVDESPPGVPTVKKGEKR